MELGQRIQKLRKSKKLSQEELGELVGVTRQTISNWEMGESAPDIKEAQELSQIFEVSLDDLVGNNLENAILKKVAKTKALTELSLGISFIHFFLFLGVIIIFLIVIFNYYKVDPVGKSVEMNCKINNTNYNYKLELDVKTDKIISFVTNDKDMEKSLTYNSNESPADVLKRVKEIAVKKGGSCN